MKTLYNRRRYAGGVPMSEEGYDGGYLTLTALLNTTFTFTIGSGVGTGDMAGIYYSLDGGDTWIYTANEAGQEVTVTTPLINKGEYVLWKGVNKRCTNGVIYLSNSSRFSSDGKFAVAGDVQSMIWGDEYETKKNTKDWFSFSRLFYGSKVKNAKNLRFEATSLSPGAYYEMFSGCTMLKVPPLKLQYDTANNGDRGIYQSIFKDCTSLKHSPDILISTLSKNSFKEAFYGCTSLQSICITSTDISASNCLQNWVQNVSPTGTFYKEINTTFPIGNSGIPTGWLDEDIIMTNLSNPEVLSVCYTQGWATHPYYMTKSEAEAVSSLGTVFRSASIVHFDELQYFTGISSVEKVFQNNSTLEYITMPATLSEIGEKTCDGCSNLKRLVILSGPTRIRNSAFNNCTSLNDISIGEGVTTIHGDSAFGGCTSLESVTLPSTMLAIGNMAFYQDSNLKELTILATTPPTLYYSATGNRGFVRGTNANLVIYVPSGSVNAYKEETDWTPIASKIQAIPT